MKDRSTPPTELESLINTRHFVRGVFALGIVASLAANVLHADDNIISRIISGWPPVALIATVEMITRVRARSSWLSFARIVATGVVAGIAAWVSYWHMAAVAREYGETTDAAHLIPFSVDGMIVVASICLVEIGRRIHAIRFGPEPKRERRSWRRAKAPEIAADAPRERPEEITPEHPVSAPAPRSGRSERRQQSHAQCTHPNTREARAACRRNALTTSAGASYDDTTTPTEGSASDESARRPGKVDPGPARWLQGHEG